MSPQTGSADMYGNVVTNAQFRALRESNCLTITPYEEKNLKAAAYTLSPGRILRRGEDREYDVVHTFSASRSAFILKANEYVIVEPKQSVIISRPGIIGTFITASTNIESGLLLVAGQIDSLYGTKGEALRFGIKNLLDSPNEITSSTRLVHLQLIDMRGSASDPVKLDHAAREVWEFRRRDENWEEQRGPNYGLTKE